MKPAQWGWLRLQIALSAMALVVVLMRSWQIMRMSAETGALALWRPIIATQAGFWIGWSLWTGVLISLVRRLVERPPSRAAGVGALVALAVLPPFLVPVVYAPIHWFMFAGQFPLHQAYGHLATHDVLTNVLMSATLVGVVYGYLSLQRARRLEVTSARLNEQLTRAQLDALRAQLDPHFLFNALNSIAVLARRGKTRDVEQMVSRLADLLRHSLDAGRSQTVMLRVELDAVRQYLEIEQVRFGDRLVVAVDVPDVLLERPVPSFILQPLVENAIRHGFADGQTPIRVDLCARSDGARLVLTVSDDGTGVEPRADTSNGVGIGNTRARLAGLYGERASLSLTPGVNGRGAIATVTLPAEAK